MRNIVVLACLIASGWALGGWVPHTHACICDAKKLWRTDPVDGATGVELNRAFIVEGVYKGGSARLENDRGEQVDVTLYEGYKGFCASHAARLVPKQPLAPNTRYVLTVETGQDDLSTSIHVTTGTETLPQVPLAPPELHADLIRGKPRIYACSSSGPSHLCVDVAPADDLELTVLRGTEVVVRVTGREVSGYAEYGHWFGESPDCIELRRIATNGQRSEPATLCGAQLAASAWPDSDSSEAWANCHSGLASVGDPQVADAGSEPPNVDEGDAGDAATSGGAKASDSGCSLTATSASAYDAVLAALSLALSWAYRRCAALRRG
jgi:hypothetical protein